MRANARHSAVVLLVILSALAILLGLFPDIQSSSLIVAVGIVSGVIEIVGFLRDRSSGEVGPQTNIAGDVQGPVFSGQFSGPVAQGGDANDFRGATGTVYKSTYNYNFPKPKEISSLPFIPDPPLNFTGRYEELKELQAQFDAGKTIIALHGFGGVGKTALSLKLVESIKDRYPDGQVMVDMRGTTDPISPMEAMGSVIRSYHREEKIPDSEAETKQRYLEVLKDKRVLLLLDNALEDKQVLKLVPPKGSGLIITSRMTITIPGSFFFKMDLDVLKPDEALELLLNVCCPAAGQQKSSRDDPAWPEIARLCGFLPLALLAAASYLANSEDVSPRQYANALADERSRLEMIGEQGVDMSVEASLGLSFQRLEPKLQQTFLDLSAFPADFDAQAEEQICRDQGHRSLSELVRWSLADYKAQGPDYGRYKLHDLARIFASARQKEEQKAAVSQRHASYYKDLLSAADDLYLKGDDSILAGLALFDREEANILAGQAWAAKSMEKDPSAAEICMSFPDAGVYVLDLRLHPRHKIAWLENGLEAARELKDRSMEEGVHMGNLGLAYAFLGEPRKAIEYYEQALAIARKIGDRRNEGAWLGNLGLAYAALSEPRKSIEHYEQTLEIDREIGDRRSEGNALGNLGLAYAALGEPRKAIEYYEQHLAIAREIGDRRGEANALGNLGNAYDYLGEPRKAIEYYEQALAIAREIGDRRGEANASWNLGLQYEKAGDLQRAAELMQICVDFEREIGHSDAEKDADRLERLREKLRKE